jgi:outer membrane biogenesis lipoprotein LolB
MKHTKVKLPIAEWKEKQRLHAIELAKTLSPQELEIRRQFSRVRSLEKNVEQAAKKLDEARKTLIGLKLKYGWPEYKYPVAQPVELPSNST